MKIQAEILGQQITVELSRLGDFQCVETMEKVVLPDDLEGGKAIEEIYASLQEVLIREVWTGEDWKFFPEPDIEIGFFLSAIDKKHLPPEIARFPENFWYDHTDEVWRKIN